MIVGIDSGKNGGIAVLHTNGAVSAFYRMPKLPGPKGDIDAASIVEILRTTRDNCGGAEPAVVVIEALTRGAGKSSWTSASVSGRIWGTIAGITQALGMPLEIVRAQDWQKIMLRGMKTDNYRARKDASLQVAGRMFPDFASLAGVRANDGVAESLLIAEYHRRMNVRKP